MFTNAMPREELIQELELGGFSTSAQDEILSLVGENIVKSVTLAALLKLPADAQDTFKKLADKGDAEGVVKLLKAHIADPDAFVKEEAQKELKAFKESVVKKLAEK